MSQNPITDDPRLTAYALDELNAADRAAVEQQIGESVETLLAIEAIREVAGQLRAALGAEPLVPATRVVAPTLAAVVSEPSPNRRRAGKIAVAAACAAMAGAFGIVAVSPRNDQHKRIEVAQGIHGLEWHDFDGEGGYPATTAEVELLREHARKLNMSGEQIAVDGYFHRMFAASGGGAAPGASLGGLSGFDVTATGNGPAVRGVGGVNGTASNEGFGARGSGSRTARLAGESRTASAPPTSAPMPALKRARPLFADESEAIKARSKRHATNPTVAQNDGRPNLAQQGLVRDHLLGAKVAALNEESSGKSVKDVAKLAEVTKLAKELESKGRQLAELEARNKELREFGYPLSPPEAPSAEAYAAIHDNPFASPLQEPLSTFSIDVDTASYSNMRRFLTQGSWPPADSVRIEEMVNYFSYDYTPPGEGEGRGARSEGQTDAANAQPFAVHMEVAGCPWNAEHRLVRVGLKGKEIALDKRPVSNLVFLIDVSGSMQPENKLPLVKAGMRRLVDQLGENDQVGIVVYAGASGLVLDSTNATQKDVILSSIENLQAGGSTNGGEGIQLAYSLARKHFINKGTNRVILCTDGDFNVGITNQDDLVRLIEEESKSGVFLSVLGFGMGNLKDSTLEKLADKGNGNYAYIDTLRECNKVFVEQMTGTLITIAKDVKIQIEFNPAQVGAYRLIGYENRVMAAQDFHDDTKDAGEIGAGHSVTALYEIVPPSKLTAPTPVTEEKLKYQPNVKSPSPKDAGLPPALVQKDGAASQELLTIKLRYKQPDADKSSLIEMPLTDPGRAFGQASTDFRFAASVASFGMILRHSPHRGNATLDAVAEIAQSSLGADKSGYRSEFVSLVRSAKALQK